MLLMLAMKGHEYGERSPFIQGPQVFTGLRYAGDPTRSTGSIVFTLGQ